MMYSKKKLPVDGFCRSESGVGTILGLTIVLLTLVVAGLAVDYSSGVEKREHLQAAADASALAAILDLPDTATATASGMAIATQFFNVSDGNAIRPVDFTYGNWNGAADTFSPNVEPINSVQVIAGRTLARGNALSTFLMGFVGRDTLDVNVSAVAYAKSDGSCENGGFFSDVKIDSNSNNDYKNGFCLYGKDGVKISSDNTFEEGTQVIMEEVIENVTWLHGGENYRVDSDGNTIDIIDNSLEEGTYTLTLPDVVDTIFANAPGGIAGFPDFITAGPIYVDKIDKDTPLAPHTLYIVAQDVVFDDNGLIKNIAIVADGNIVVGSFSEYYNVVFASRSKVLTGSNNKIGHPDACAHGKYSTYLFSNSNIEFGSNNDYNGLQMGAQGMIKLGSALDGFQDIYGEANQNIEYGSNDVFGGCPGGLESDYLDPGATGIAKYVKFALVR